MIIIYDNKTLKCFLKKLNIHKMPKIFKLECFEVGDLTGLNC